jgi:hypothetical protein
MTTSGTYDFNLTVSEIIEEAFENCGLEARTGNDLQTAARSLNLLLQEWSNRGLHLWTVQSLTIPMVANQSVYNLPASSVDILEAVLRRNGIDLRMDRVSRADYMHTPDKAISGRPHRFLVTRAAIPTVTLWPVPDNPADTMVLTVMRRVQDVGVYSNTPDVVSRFLPALIAGLTFKIAIKRAPERAEAMAALYQTALTFAMEEDVERVSFRAVPPRGYTRVR